MFPLAAAGAPALWYLSRGSGAVSLILLTTSVVLGIVDQQRWRSERWPRFTLHALHRWISLFAVSFLTVHILSAVLDSFAPIRLVDAVIPFASRYRPLWLGFGAVAFDMLLAVTVTSLLRKRIGQRAWRTVHWLSYAAWPVALVHGLGSGSDVRAGWLLAITIVCAVAVWIAVFMRVMGAAESGPRLASFGALMAVPVALLIWLPQGPLAKGWARRAGTPARLLLARNITPRAQAPAAATSFKPPFSGYLGGTINESSGATGIAEVDIAMRISGGADGAAEVILEGAPLPSGGVSVQRSRVTLGPASDPRRYRGHVVLLRGTDIEAEATDRAGNTLRAEFRLALEQARVEGTVSVVPA
jgi:DMSO/TMAO reductase YedYZ heme-binding membrane subunit